MDRLLSHRLPAPSQRLIDRTPGLGDRRRLVEACRGELAWAREDWLRIAGQLGLAADPRELSPTRFHNSVHNAPAGYWTVAAHCHAPAA